MQAPRRLQLRRGNTSAVSSYLGAAGELIVNTDNNTLYIHDGVTVGGHATTVNVALINNQIASVNANITQANVGMQGYVDFSIRANIANIAAGYTNTNVKSYLGAFDGNIIPSANVTYSLGNITHQWRDLFVSNNTIYVGGVPLSIDATGNLTINGNTIPTIGYVNTAVANVQVDLTGYATVANLTAANLGMAGYVDSTVSTAIADLIGGAPSTLDTLYEISNSLANNVSLSSSLLGAIANVQANVDAVTWDQDLNTTNNVNFANIGTSTGQISVPTDTDFALRLNHSTFGEANVIVDSQGYMEITGGYTGRSFTQTIPGEATPIGYFGYSANVTNINGVNGLILETGIEGSGGIWQFDTNSDLTVPGYVKFAGNTYIGDEPGSGNPAFRIVAPLGYGATIETDSDITGNSWTWTFGVDGTLGAPGTITAVGVETDTVTIGIGGNITFPDSTVQTTAYTGSTYSNVQVATYLPTHSGNVGANNVNAAKVTATSQVAVDSLSITNNRIDAITQFAIATSNTASGDGTTILMDRNGGGFAVQLIQGGAPFSWGLYSDNLLFPDGTRQYTAYTGATGSNYSNVNVAAYLATATITTTGNITAQNLIGNISITGNVTGTSANVTLQAGAYSSVFDNQGNVRLPSAYVSGNVSANYFIGNGALLTGIVAGSNYSNINVATYLPTYSGNIANLTVTNTLTLTATKIALGYLSGLGGAGQGTNSVAVGSYSGYNTQGNSAVAIGVNAGMTQGDDTVAIGSNAGGSQTTQAVAVGFGAGQSSQSMGGVAVGYASGQTAQGLRAVAIGSVAGNDHQGAQSIAIGHNAGYSNQPANSIEFNATGTALDYTNLTAGLYITSVKNDTANVTNVMYYNTTTKEITYGPASGGSSYSNVQVATYLPTYTGNIANIRLGVAGVLTFADGTTMATASAIGGSTYGNANVASYLITNGYVNTNSAYGNGNVASYLITNQYINANSAYSNANVTSYLPTHSGNVGVNSIIGTTPNVTLIAGTYISTFDNQGNVTLSGNTTVGGMGVIMPTRPAFRVNGTSLYAGAQSTANVNLKGVAVSTQYNQGNYFDAATGKFTAPVAGIYEVLLNARVNSSFNSLAQLVVLKNGNNDSGNIVAFWETTSNIGGATHFGVSGTINLAVGDYLSANILAGNVTFDQNDNWSVTYLG